MKMGGDQEEEVEVDEPAKKGVTDVEDKDVGGAEGLVVRVLLLLLLLLLPLLLLLLQVEAVV